MKNGSGWLVLAWVVLSASSRLGEAVDIVKGGTPLTTIVLPDAPKAEEKAAAGELAAYLEKMTGARLEQKPPAQAGAGPRIHVGLTAFVAQQKLG
ncbi:MAG: hypothetical protein FJ278_09815, partial [Planctomycetes bacterium]|nr:hypothetical protein [Planctomycetota bacterium]